MVARGRQALVLVTGDRLDPQTIRVSATAFARPRRRPALPHSLTTNASTPGGCRQRPRAHHHRHPLGDLHPLARPGAIIVDERSTTLLLAAGRACYHAPRPGCGARPATRHPVAAG
ncbi:hypothetical protein DSL92_07450 [Billgrantia gudaonensis]|uniref:Uncharacterized protein n=1 Tax=Billgrantia gudaonensis TaxID=376427 RepID=A0A3S0NWP4_9GAMM|nr:hypothetical protein DSL92_07450 [Halomonas gudaonensis]